MSRGQRASAPPPLVWSPTPEQAAATRLVAYVRWLAAHRDVTFADYEDLHGWSVADLDGFWRSIWDFFDVGHLADGHPAPVLADERMPGARWLPGARLNWAEHVLAAGSGDQEAVVALSEQASRAAVTRRELRSLVARAAEGLRRRGVGLGDTVVAYLPNGLEAVVGVLAATSLGATWSSCSPDFGAEAVVDRFAQLEPKVLIAATAYEYGGRRFDRAGQVAALQRRLTTLEHAVVGPDGWSELLAHEAPLRFARVPFEHPLWVLWSSGTTGKPKGLVHGHGGILLEQLKEQALHGDVRDGDRAMWFTTTGWMMWNYLLGCLLHGATIVLYDGNPGWPQVDRLWHVARQESLTLLGTSPAYLAACRKADVRPTEGGPLPALRAVGVTGSPLAADDADHVSADLPGTWVYSMSGGSDVCTAFLGGVPTEPAHRGEMQGRQLGAAVQSLAPDGRPLIGQVGELVLSRPMPSMPVGLVGDRDGERYRSAYFDTWPGVWRHGDWLTLTERGSAVLHGRSDATINRGGVRMGTAELYAAVLREPQVLEALAVDAAVGEGADSRLLLFVKLAPGVELDDRLTDAIRRRLRADCSPRHVPDAVHAVPALPRTLSGKVLEVPVKRLLEGADAGEVATRDALQDPSALDWFAEHARQLIRS